MSISTRNPVRWASHLGLLLSASSGFAAQDALLDNWDQAPRIVAASPVTAAGLNARQKPEFANPDFKLRYDRSAVGAFSLEIAKPGQIALLGSLWDKTVAIPKAAKLEFYLSSASALPPEISVALASGDATQVKTIAKPVATKDGWTRFEAAFPADFPPELNSLSLDLSAVSADTLLDGVVLRGADGGVFGITDKPVAQWMAEALATRTQRAQTAFKNGSGTNFSGELRQWFDKMWLGQELPECNAALKKMLLDQLTLLKENRADLWDLAMNVRLIEMYYELGSRRTSGAPVLTPENEKLLLQVLWERTKNKNDIGWASTSTWWLTGSENHDLNAKVSNLITSRIFMNEPEYRDRLYPDAAHSPGFGYWFHTMYGPEGSYGPVTPAPWKASGQHNAAEHYQAWVSFFDQYITERAKKGFFLERASPVYMKWTLDFLHTLHRYGGNESLKKKTGDLLDAVWVDWAQEQIAGVRGGPKTRHRHTVGGYDSMTDMARFLFGGPGTTNHIYTAMLLDDFALPPVIWDIALDTKGRGNYELASRGVGEEQPIRPRPVGTERTLMTDTVSRFLKYSWVTPDYILGTQMDYPDAVESHLSAVDRWHGLIVAGSPETRILPTGGEMPAEGGKMEPDMSLMYQTAQSRNVLILQQARRWLQISPDWFPSTPMYEKPVVIYTGLGWDEVREEGGWVFFRHGSSYAALREVLPKRAAEKTGPLLIQNDSSIDGNPDLVQLDVQPVKWVQDHKGIALADKFSAVILHAGSATEHGTFDKFRATVLTSQLELHKTVVPGYYWITYKGAEPEAREIRFEANTPEVPFIGGQPVNYQPEDLFAGPFMQSKYGSGVITIRKGDYKLNLDFNRPLPKRTVYMIGDSTMADKIGDPPEPETGWGQIFKTYFHGATFVSNYAMNGRSTKSFIDEGRWQYILDRIKPGDYVIMEFAHNDEKKEDPSRYTAPHEGYRDNLLRFVKETREKGATPILATPICRRRFDQDGKFFDTHGDYPAVVREVAKEQKVELLDLHDDTEAFIKKAGPEGSRKFFISLQPGVYPALPQGRTDDTHLSVTGATKVADCAIADLRKINSSLVKDLKDQN